MGARSTHRAAWVAATACVLVLAATGSARAALVDRLCLPSGAATLPAWPSDADLRSAADRAEARLALRGAVDPYAELMPALDVPAAGGARPTPEAVSQYCAAAGELMRVSAQGSQLQAQSYLLGAFQVASRAGLKRPASMAAYRLGLVSLSGAPAAGGTRGARRGVRGPSAAVQEAGQIQGERPCDLLMRTAFIVNASLPVSIASLGCAAEQARDAGDLRTAALAELRLARLRLSVAEANPVVAADFRTQAARAAWAGLADAAGLSSPSERADILGRLASAGLDAGASTDLAPVFAAMRADASPAAQAYASALEARVRLAAGDAAGARRLIDQALLLESQRSLPARLPEFHLILADVDPARREAHVLAAYEALDAIRPLLPRFDPLTEETAFSLYMRRVFQGAVDVQLAAADGSAEAARVQGAQQILEAYRQAELQSVFGSECIPVRDPLRPETLRKGEVLLYPILLPDRLELLYVTGGEGGQARFRRLAPNRSVDRQRIARLVETAVVSLSGPPTVDWRAASRELYDILIKPIEGELGPDSLLAIVPDGALRSLPFAVLLDDRNRYLVQRTRVAIAPALAYSQSADSGDEDRLQLVAAALEMDVTLPAGRFEKLTGTSSEARLAAVADGRRVSRAWLIENFSKQDLVRALTREQVDVLHLATHASFNGRSDRAFIVANGEMILLSELRQILSQNRTRGGELDLLVLSACETAVGDDEASMGLAGAAVQAGAKSAIASLWPVSDVGTAELMKTFYTRYREGRSKSEALRDAQLALIDRGGEMADPNIWAAFTLLGAWR